MCVGRGEGGRGSSIADFLLERIFLRSLTLENPRFAWPFPFSILFASIRILEANFSDIFRTDGRTDKDMQRISLHLHLKKNSCISIKPCFDNYVTTFNFIDIPEASKPLIPPLLKK